MQRITTSLSGKFAADLAVFMDRGGYSNRSAAVRDPARFGLDHARIDHRAAGDCVASPSYVFRHHVRGLPNRLMDAHHYNCLEVTVLRGNADSVRHSAKTATAERGVTCEQLSLVPAVV